MLILVVGLTACRLERADSGRPPGQATAADSLARLEADSAVRADVTFTLNRYYARYAARDWNGLRRSFWPGGTITTRFTPPGERRERIWTVDVDEFIRRGPDGPGRPAVFSERLLYVEVRGYGDLADAWAIHERRSGTHRDSVRVMRGIDAFHLYRDGAEWRIVNLAFTGEVPGRPIEPPRRPRRSVSRIAAGR